MDALLILPNVYIGNRIGDHESKEPLGLLYLVAVLRQIGHRATVIQADYYGLSVEQTAQVALLHEPEVIGFSVTQRAAPATIAIIERLRVLGYRGHICCGGYLPSLCPQEFLAAAPGVDSVVIGEGEVTFPELVGRLAARSQWQDLLGIAYRYQDGRVVVNALRPAIQNLDALPYPDRQLLSDAFHRMGYATVITSRGCYGNCTFCSQNAFKQLNPGPRWRGRNPSEVVSELERIWRDFGIATFKFNDDDIFGPGTAGRKRIVGICEELLRRNLNFHLMAYCRINDVEEDMMQLMRRAGFERLLVGVESILPPILSQYRKGIFPEQIYLSFALLKRLGFTVIPGFMMFNPYTTIEGLPVELAFLREAEAYGVSISKTLKVHDGTDIKSILQAQGRLRPVPFTHGYHEYEVDSQVARVYAALKLIWIKLIDPLQDKLQHVITRLKKSHSFNTRQDYDQYLRMVWEVQADVLLRLVEWVRQGMVSKEEVRRLVVEVIDRMSAVANFLRQHNSVAADEAHQYRLYPLRLQNGNTYCLDLVSSQLFPVDAPLLAALKLMESEQSTEHIDVAVRIRLQELRSTGQLQPALAILPLAQPDSEDIARQVIAILQDCNLKTMTERYVWSPAQ